MTLFSHSRQIYQYPLIVIASTMGYLPDYESLMRPILEITSDRKEKSMSDAVSDLSIKFSLSKQEREKLLPSGSKTIFYDRIHWALLYLKHARLVESTRKGHFQITSRGMNVLNTANHAIDKEYLKQFPEFSEYIKGKKKYYKVKVKKEA